MLRMTGLLTLSPIFGRQNIPTLSRMGLAFFLSVLLMGTVRVVPDLQLSLLQLLYHALFELAIGMMVGVVFRMFLSVLFVGGDVIDTQMGISMSKSFDPSSNMSISTTANLLNAMFYLLFFLTNSHHTFFRMAAQTFNILPLGGTQLNPNAFYYIAELMSTIFILAIKLSMPIVIIELIVTMAVGIIMRVVPQINIFAVNIQFKLAVGLVTLLLLVPAFSGFIENLITICFEQVGEILLISR